MTSTHELAELALSSAVALDTLVADGKADLSVVRKFADALQGAATNLGTGQGAAYFSGGYHASFMNLARGTHGAGISVIDTRNLISKRVEELRSLLSNPEGCDVSSFVDFCVKVHRELTSSHLSELRLAKRRDSRERIAPMSRRYGEAAGASSNRTN